MERREKCRRSKKSIAGAIGQTVASKASIAGAAGGCQYEIGTASAMAAAALCYLGGGDAEAICHAAALPVSAVTYPPKPG